VVPEGSKAKQDIKGAKLAVTHYRVLERLPGHTVVEVKLETGRRNQIRVQFAERGFPLLGDQVYGARSESLDRQALHAELLGFRHPVTEETITVTAPMPSDMEHVLKALRNARRVVRAEAGTTGEAGIYKPKITKERKVERRKRSERFSEEPAAAPARPRNARPGIPQPRPGAGAPRPAARSGAAAAPRPAARSGAAAAPRSATRSSGTGSPRPLVRGAARKSAPKKPSK